MRWTNTKFHEDLFGLGLELVMLVEFHVEEFSTVYEGLFELEDGFGGVWDGGLLEGEFEGVDFGLEVGCVE